MMTEQAAEPEVGASGNAFPGCDEIYFMSIVIEYTAGVVEQFLLLKAPTFGKRWSGD